MIRIFYKANRFFIVVLTALFGIICIFLAVPKSVMGENTEKVRIVYFYTSVCASCNEAEKTMDEINETRTSSNRRIMLDVRMFNIENKRNLELFQKYLDTYEVPDSMRYTPIIFIGNSYYQGKEQIKAGLQDEFMKDFISDVKILELTGEDEERVIENFLNFKVFGIFAAGFLSGFNPCSLSMLLFFMSMIITRKSSVRKMGLAFCAGKFIAYFLLGTLLYGMLAKLHGSWFSMFAKALLCTFALFIAGLSIKDYFAAKNEKYDKIKNQLPLTLRRFNHKWIQRIASVNSSNLLFWMSFSLGLIISVGEFLCTGQIYIATISYMIQNQTVLGIQAFLYMLIYVAAFILPLIFVIFAVERGKEVFKISEALRKMLPVIKLITGIGFILFAFVIVFLT